MATLVPFSTCPERAILEVLLDGLITTAQAQQYLANIDFWRENYSSFPQDTWVGVDNGTIYQGFSADQVSQMIYTADPNANPYIGYVPNPPGV